MVASNSPAVRPSPRERLGAFMEANDLTQEGAAELFDCTQTYVSKVLRGERSPGLKLAFSIEASTRGTAHAIAAQEWIPTPAESLEATGTGG